MNNCKVSDIELPKGDNKKYEYIRNAVMHYNNRMRTSITCDTILEQFDVELTADELLIIAHYIRLLFLINQKTYYVNVWNPFSGDISLKNYKEQLNALETDVTREVEVIDKLIFNAEEDFL